MVQSLKSIFYLLTLRFRNKKLDRKFDDSIPYEEKKKVNLRIGLIGWLISSVLLIWSIFLSKTVDWNLQLENLSVLQIEQNQMELYSNQTSLFYAQYVMGNLNLTSENIQIKYKQDIYYENINTPSYTSLKNNIDYFGLLKQFAFTARLLPVCYITWIFHFIIFSATLSSKNWSVQSFIFLCSYLLLGYNFHILSAIFLIFYGFTTYSVFFIVTTQLFIKMIVIMIAKSRWTNILLICILTILVEWVGFIVIHNKVRHPLVLYLYVNGLIHLFSVIFSYYTEYNNKTNFYLLHQLNFEREYLMNFLFNMEEGFFTFSNNKVLFMNKSMQNIVNTFAELMKFYINPEISQTESLNNLLKNQKEMIYKQKRVDTSIGIIPDSKYLVEKLLENLAGIDKELPSEIKDFFKGKREIKLNELLNLFKNVKNSHNEFITLGLFDFETLNKNKSLESQLDIDLNMELELEVKKKYSVGIRVIENAENHDEFLEIKFSDNFSNTKEEKEKKVNENLILFIPKIAHELKNPLKYLLQLNENINDSCKNTDQAKNNSSLITILNFSENSRTMGKLIKLELKSLFVISKIKTKCIFENSCIEDGQLKCLKCNLKKICTKCKACLNCEQRKKSNVDFDQFIKRTLEIFKQLSIFEKKNINFSFDYNSMNDSICDSRSSGEWLKFLNLNSEIIQCIVFNLIYFSYKNTQEGQVTLNFYLKDQEKLKISVNNTGKEIDSIVLKNLFQSKNIYRNFFIGKNFAKFNEHSNLIFAHFLIKNIGSYLLIESEEGNNTMSFVINSVEMKTASSSDSSLFDNSDIITDSEKRKNSIYNNIYLSTKLEENSNDSSERNKNKLENHQTDIKSVHLEIKDKKNNLDFSRTITSSFDSEESQIVNNITINENNYISFGKNVLILDDQLHVRESLKTYFKKFQNIHHQKFHIFEAENPFDALSTIYKLMTKDKKYFDFIIYDHCMPLIKESNLNKNVSQFYKEAQVPDVFFINNTNFDNPHQLGEEVRKGMTWIKPVSYKEFEDFFKE
jgi:signal transduction histidine kinase